MPVQIPEPSAILNGDGVAHVVTVNPDGSPNVTLALVGLDEDEIVFATLPDQRKLRNLRGDPRVSLSIETGNRNAFGLTEYLVIHGTARISEGGAPGLLQDLARTYLGPDVKFPPMPDPPPGFVTHITIERVGGIGPWSSW